tara:strand:- start:534 stop:767 length:234 start_codon:yes stop_codon:yes gene_type:complete
MSASRTGDDGGAHSPIPHLPPAAQPDLVRARQKDDYYRKVYAFSLLKLENEIPYSRCLAQRALWNARSFCIGVFDKD